MLPTKPVSRAATWMVAGSLLMLNPAFAGQKPKSWIPGIEPARLNGNIIEIAENWFAPDREGNIWYFGEFTRDFENGVEVSTAGSWEAGVNDARPGIIMKAHPTPGDTYFQEFAPGVAQDMASVISITRRVSVMGRAFDNVLLTKEWTALQSNSVEHKSYAPGVGLILEEKGGARLELVGMN